VAFKLGQLVIELAANTARLQGDMGKAVGIAERGAAQLKKAFSFATAGVGGGLIGTFLIGAAKNAVKFGDDLNRAAIKAGIGGKAISELAYAAKLADVDIASLSTALKKMQVALSEAATGNKQAKGALDALGLSLQQLQRLKPEDQFELIGDRISRLKDPADRARAATELFGKAGADLLPFFEQGATGIAKARQEAEKLGASLSDETMKRLSDLDDAGKRIGASWDALATTFTAKVAPALTTVFDALAGTRAAELRQQIAFLEKVKGRGFVAANPLGSAGAYKDIGTGIFSAEEGAALLQKLQAQLDLIEGSKYNLGGRGRPASVPGFAAADGAAKAAEAAKKAAADQAKEMEKFLGGYRDAVRDMNADVDRESDALLEKDLQRWMDRQDAANEFYEAYLDREKEAQALRDRNAMQTAAFFKDTVLAAFDDMVNGTKIKWSEMLKYLALQTARAGLVKLLDNAFTPKAPASASNGKSGFLSAAGNFLSSLFSGESIDGKAGGGPVSAGRTYLVGERGMELFRPNTNGSIVPNNRLGGGPVTIAPTYHINNPDNTARLPSILAENNRRLMDDLARSGLLAGA
jgi:hypothetical protein